MGVGRACPRAPPANARPAALEVDAGACPQRARRTGPPGALPRAQKPNLLCEAPSPGTRYPAMPGSGGVGMGIHRVRPAFRVSRPASNGGQPTLQGDELSNRLVLMKCGERRKARAGSLGRDMPECRSHLTAHQHAQGAQRGPTAGVVCAWPGEWQVARGGAFSLSPPGHRLSCCSAHVKDRTLQLPLSATRHLIARSCAGCCRGVRLASG